MRLPALNKAAKADISWEPEAEEALAKVPRFVRSLVRRKVRERVAAENRNTVTLADFGEAENRFRSLMAGKSEKELKSMMPQANKMGASLVIAETCRSKAVDCPNSLFDTGPWIRAIEDWAKDFGLSEKLRGLVDEDKVLFHHKIKFSISGCPNGCSRPQIVDFGLRGRVWPSFDEDECTYCGACALICPDRALTVENGPPLLDQEACQGCQKCSSICPVECVTLSEPKVELLVGGKLGRHPRLAQSLAVFSSPDELISRVEVIMEQYLKSAAPGQRFADFWIENG